MTSNAPTSSSSSPSSARAGAAPARAEVVSLAAHVKPAGVYHKLESLRGVAACCVALHHSPFMLGSAPSGFVASSYLFVDFFFILSGFVMTHAYREQITHGMPFKRYALLRVGRLYPLHVFAHLLYAFSVLCKWLVYHAGVGASDPTESLNFASFWTNLFLLQGLGVHDYLYWNRPSWSIGAELFAYLAFFGLTATLDRRGRILPPLVGALLLYVVMLAFDERRLDITYDFGLVRCVAGFYLGSALLRLQKRWGARLELGRAAQGVAEAVCLALGLICVGYARASNLFVAGAVLSFAACIWVFSSRASGALGGLLGATWLRKIGLWSYSIYLLHLVCLEVGGDLVEFALGIELSAGIGPRAIFLNAVVLAVIIAVSRWTYERIERPFRDLAKARVA